MRLQVLLRALHDAHALGLIEEVGPIAGLGEDGLAVRAGLARLQCVDGLLRIGLGKLPAALPGIAPRGAFSERDGLVRAQIAGFQGSLDAVVECAEHLIAVSVVLRAQPVADGDPRGLRDVGPAGVARLRHALAQHRVHARLGEAGHLLLEVRARSRTHDALRGRIERLQQRLAIALRRGRVISIARELLVDVELRGDEVLLGRRAIEPVLHVQDLIDALSRDVAEGLHGFADLTRVVVRDDPRGIGCHRADVLRCTEGFGKLGHEGLLHALIPRPSSATLNARTGAGGTRLVEVRTSLERISAFTTLSALAKKSWSE